ncbi:hypothetical protein ES708_13178 [subsurface metagenome]
MKKFLKSHHTGGKLIALIASVMTIILLAVPVLAVEMTPEQKLANAAQLSAQASEMAIIAEETGNVEMAKEAMAIADEASRLIAEVVTYAGDTGNTELAQSAMNEAANLVAAINQITETAQYLVQTGTDPAVVNAAKEILVKAGEVRSLNRGTMELAMAAGATPPPVEAYEPPAPPDLGVPVDDEPPIQDTTAASPT